MSRLLITAIAIGAMAAGAWLALRPPDLPPIEGPGPGPADAVVAGRAGPGATTGVEARPVEVPGAVRTKSGVLMAPPPATLFNEYIGATEYRILYDRLANSSEGETAEGRLVLYEILRQCALVTDGPRPGYKANPPPREAFVQSVPVTDPQREKRIQAYEAFAVDRCKGLDGLSVRYADLMKLLEESAARGSVHARALALEQQLWQSRRGGNGTVTDEQFRALQEIAGSKDPEALRVAGRIMANSWRDYSLRVGPQQLPIEQRAFVNAFLVLSCEYGAPCGADTPRMLEACALRGHCDARNFPDYLYYYGSTPHDADMLTQYREIIRRAIETGDWSQVTLVRNDPPGRHRITFVPGPR